MDRPRVLILTPLRHAAPHLEKHFELLSPLTYPHHSIDLAFLVGDFTDDSLEVLHAETDTLQKDSDPAQFRTAKIILKNFGAKFYQRVEYRRSFAAQGSWRWSIGRARN